MPKFKRTLKTRIFNVSLILFICIVSSPSAQFRISQSFVEPRVSVIEDLNSHFDTTYTEITHSIIHADTAWKTWDQVENFAFGKNRGNIPMIADLQALHPFFRDKVIALIQRCKSQGIELAIVETYRTHAKQSEYYRMGRKYTRAKQGKSRHQYGLAVDVVPIVNGEAVWNNKRLWRKIGLTGERLGLRWGGRWKNLYDPAHFEWTGGVSTRRLKKGILPSVPKNANYPCLHEDLESLRKNWKAWETAQSGIAKSALAKNPNH